LEIGPSRLRYVSFDNVPVAETFAVKTPNWGVSLVDAPQASMMVPAIGTAANYLDWI